MQEAEEGVAADFEALDRAGIAVDLRRHLESLRPLARHLEGLVVDRGALEILDLLVEQRAVEHRRRTRIPFERDIGLADRQRRSEEHTSELQSLMRISYAVF